MPLSKVKFEPLGETIYAEIVVRTPQIASYTMALWERGSNVIVAEWRGNNQNPQDDKHALPMPANVNDGRLLELDVTLVAAKVAKGAPYCVGLILTQGNKTLATLEDRGAMGSSTAFASVYAKLVEERQYER